MQEWMKNWQKYNRTLAKGGNLLSPESILADLLQIAKPCSLTEASKCPQDWTFLARASTLLLS